MSYTMNDTYTSPRALWRQDNTSSTISMTPRPQALPQAESKRPKTPPETDDIYIAVMGVTGAGKSRFISQCSGQDVEIGHTLESCTTEVDDYSFVWKDKTIHLIDTPGFDDTHKSDREVLEGIATWMSTAYSQDIKLSGVLYLHRVSDVRVGGTSLRNLTMFKKLCGDEFYPRVFLVTTMWDKVSKAEGEKREKELISKSDFWGAMIEGGAHCERHFGSRDSAMDILGEVVRNRGIKAPKVLKVQHEMVDDGLRLDETTAGRQFEAELLKLREKHEREVKEMQEDVKMLLDMNQKKAADETERQRKIFEDRIAQSFDDQAKLKSSLQQIQQRQAEELARMQEQVARDRAAYEEKIRSLQYAQNNLKGMDPNSQGARNLGSQISQGQRDAAEMAKTLDVENKTFEKKMKRVFIKSKDWVKQNPNLVRYVAKNGISLLLKIAECEILTELTGVPMAPFARVINSWAWAQPQGGDGSGEDGGDDGGGDVFAQDGGLEFTNPASVPVSDPSTDYLPPLDFNAGGFYFGPESTAGPPLDPIDTGVQGTYDTYPEEEAPPAYPYSPSVYSVELNPYTLDTQQETNSAIGLSQQFEADQAQQVANQVPTSGIAAGTYDGYQVDDMASQMNQMNMASSMWQPLQSAASMPIG